MSPQLWIRLYSGAVLERHLRSQLGAISRIAASTVMTGVTAFEVASGKARYVKDYIFDQNVLAQIWPPKAAAVAESRSKSKESG